MMQSHNAMSELTAGNLKMSLILQQLLAHHRRNTGMRCDLLKRGRERDSMMMIMSVMRERDCNY